MLKLTFTSEWRLHCGFDEPGQELEIFWVLAESGCEGAQGLGVPAQTLKGHAFPIVGLEREINCH